jgi:hypothetical protein
VADTPEVKVKKRLKALYKELGILCVQPIGTVFTQSGVHDHILCVNGIFVSVEVKAGSRGPTAFQERFGTAVLAAGGFAFCVNEVTFDAVATALRNCCAAQTYDSASDTMNRLSYGLCEMAGLDGSPGVYTFGRK